MPAARRKSSTRLHSKESRFSYKDIEYKILHKEGYPIQIYFSYTESPYYDDSFNSTLSDAKERAKEVISSRVSNPMSRSAHGAHTGRKIKQIRNPSEAMQEAEDMVRRFHGREPKEVIDLIEEEEYDEDLPVLGQLMELNILTHKGKAYVPIVFCKMQGNKPKMKLEDMIQVCSDSKGENILFKGGEQELDIQKLVESGVYQELGSKGSTKEVCIVGPVFSIVYFADKHHLEGPKYQEKGAPYEHHFGERADQGEEGEMPMLVYDTRNKRMFLSGGSYEIRDEGIFN